MQKNKILIIVIISGIAILLFIPIITFFYNIINTVESSISEYNSKKNIIRKSKITKVILNDEILNDTEAEKIIKLIIKTDINSTHVSIRPKANNYNNDLKFLTDTNKIIDFKFYFSKKCWNNKIKVEKEMMEIEGVAPFFPKKVTKYIIFSRSRTSM